MPSESAEATARVDPVRPRDRRESKGQARKRQIIEVATRILARNGARGTTLTDIAIEVGISQGAVVYHFRTKDELLQAVLANRDQFENDQLWKNGPDPGLEIFDIIASIVRSWAVHPEIVGLLAVLLAENVGDDGPLRSILRQNYELTIDRIRSTLRAAQDRQEINADVDPRRKAIEILAFVSGLELAWLITPDLPAAETATQWAQQQRKALTG